MIAALRAACFIRSAGDSAVAEVYHDRIRDVLTTALGRDAERVIHGRIARALTSRRIEDPEMLFEHYMCANEWAEAGAGGRGGDAIRGGVCLRTGGRLLSLCVDSRLARRAERLRLKSVLQRRCRTPAGQPNPPKCISTPRMTRPPPPAALELRRRAAEQFLAGGHVDRGLDTIESVLSAVGLRLAGGPRRALLSLLMRRAELLFRGLSFVTRAEHEIAEDVLTRIDTCWAVATGLAVIDSIRAADFKPGTC